MEIDLFMAAAQAVKRGRVGWGGEGVGGWAKKCQGDITHISKARKM